MICSIYCARSLTRQVSSLQKSGRKGELAAAQFARIVELLRSVGPEIEEVFSQRTKRGEYRIKNCVKYDLGSGYRLITIRVGDRLYIPFLGDHDAADLWLERHKQDGFQPRVAAYQCHPIVKTCQNDPEAGNPGPTLDVEDRYEMELRERLDESMLKSLFPGLFRKESDELAAVSRPITASARNAAKYFLTTLKENGNAGNNRHGSCKTD